MTTEHEEWKEKYEYNLKLANQRVKELDQKIADLQKERDEQIIKFRIWAESHKRREPPKTGYPARMGKYIKGKEWLREV